MTHSFTIWVDADACPNAMKQILYKAAERTRCALVLVANARLSHPPSAFIRSVQVERGFDSADSYIVEHLSAGDLVVTADIPLAYDVLQKSAHALNPRGELYTSNHIKQLLDFRQINEQLRSSGEKLSGPPALGNKDKAAFANALDKWLAKHHKPS